MLKLMGRTPGPAVSWLQEFFNRAGSASARCLWVVVCIANVWFDCLCDSMPRTRVAGARRSDRITHATRILECDGVLACEHERLAGGVASF